VDVAFEFVGKAATVDAIKVASRGRAIAVGWVSGAVTLPQSLVNSEYQLLAPTAACR
jgi:hypothetical protein